MLFVGGISRDAVSPNLDCSAGHQGQSPFSQQPITHLAQQMPLYCLSPLQNRSFLFTTPKCYVTVSIIPVTSQKSALRTLPTLLRLPPPEATPRKWLVHVVVPLLTVSNQLNVAETGHFDDLSEEPASETSGIKTLKGIPVWVIN